MSYAHSYSRQFSLNGVSFRHYHAQDAHGSVTDTYYIDDKIVERYQFMASIQNGVRDAEYYIASACGLSKIRIPDWSKN